MQIDFKVKVFQSEIFLILFGFLRWELEGDVGFVVCVLQDGYRCKFENCLVQEYLQTKFGNLRIFMIMFMKNFFVLKQFLLEYSTYFIFSIFVYMSLCMKYR